MYVHIGIIGRDRTTQLSLALLVIVSDSVTLGERAYNNWFREIFILLCSRKCQAPLEQWPPLLVRLFAQHCLLG